MSIHEKNKKAVRQIPARPFKISGNLCQYEVIDVLSSQVPLQGRVRCPNIS